MPQSADVETGVPDLSGVRLSELLRQDGSRFTDTRRALISRIDQPSRSISGYNPQRLD
jgi:hypothetical protein